MGVKLVCYFKGKQEEDVWKIYTMKMAPSEIGCGDCTVA
jgi:hypothetical protein